MIPFPADRARRPDRLHRQLNDWARARNTALAVRHFGPTEGDATAVVRLAILEGGAFAVARLLEETSHAIGLLRGAVAELVDADRLISAAADRVLAEAGL